MHTILDGGLIAVAFGSTDQCFGQSVITEYVRLQCIAGIAQIQRFTYNICL